MSSMPRTIRPSLSVFSSLTSGIEKVVATLTDDGIQFVTTLAGDVTITSVYSAIGTTEEAIDTSTVKTTYDDLTWSDVFRNTTTANKNGYIAAKTMVGDETILNDIPMLGGTYLPTSAKADTTNNYFYFSYASNAALGDTDAIVSLVDAYKTKLEARLTTDDLNKWTDITTTGIKTSSSGISYDQLTATYYQTVTKDSTEYNLNMIVQAFDYESTFYFNIYIQLEAVTDTTTDDSSSSSTTA